MGRTEEFFQGAFTRFCYDSSTLDFNTTRNKEIEVLPKPNAKQQHTLSFSNTETGAQEEAQL